MKKRKAAVLAAAAFAMTAAFFLNGIQRAEAADNVVVMLDPGHDSTHTGAAAYGLKEQQLNLKIGLACRTELEKYDGITVYMTHDTIACPFEGSTTKQDLIQRTEYAGEVGADLFVSLHNNSGDDSGYEIYYPNNHYVSEFNDIGYAVSEHIAGYLSEMGIYRNGLYTRDSDGEEDDDTNWYPDGSRADYYSVIRNSKYNGVPGIIVEHAYLSDAGDTHVFLSNDNMLVRMGQADASGIADYFGLHKKNGLCTDKYGDWHYYEDGEVSDYTGMALNEYGWWYFENGQLNREYTGMAHNEYGWWYFENGLLNEEYTGIGANSYGEWYYQQGRIGYDFSGKVKFDDTEYTITEGYVVEKRIVNETEADTADTVHTAGTLPAGEESSTLGK